MKKGKSISRTGSQGTVPMQTEGLISALAAEGMEATEYRSSEELIDLTMQGLLEIVDELLPLADVADSLLLQKEWHDSGMQMIVGLF